MKQEKFSVKSINVDSRVKSTKRILANMQTFVSGTGKGSILLDGDPGVGKTSYVKFLARLLGIRLVTIEAPHITEEHIINIPFIVFNPKTNKAESKTTSEKVSKGEKDFNIVLADSNLFKEIKSIVHIPDSDYLNSIYHGAGSTDDLIKTFETFGGSESKIPPIFIKLRDKFKCILFLDEFFRQTSPRIRNMLRGILNGKIGMHDLPPHVYAMYASNLNDQGIDGIPLNYQFTNINFAAPNKDEWFSWFYSKYNKPDSGVKLNTDILEKFHNILEDEHLSHTDFDAEVRVSPRRWEQVLLYINSSLPVKDAEDAKSLITNIQHSFQNYKTGEKSEILTKVNAALVELIKETSNIDISSSDTNEGSKWRKTLQHQIEQKIKLGDHRTYIPVISGKPGVGKTSEIVKMADDLDMGLVQIDVSTLDPEDVTGIPLADGDDENISVKFSSPKLYKIIHDKIKAIDTEFVNHIKTKYKGDSAKLKELGKRKYQHIIFFDELNRTSTKVFNGIRRVILDKSFSDELKVDDRAIIVAAINPDDVGASDLTDHVKDVVDIIHTDPNWKSTLAYMNKMNVDVENDVSKEIAKDTIETFSEKFKSKDKQHQKSISNFYLDIGSSDVYISPREYTDLYSNMSYSLDIEITEIYQKYNEFNNDTIAIIEKQIRTNLYESLESSLRNIMHKQDSTSPEFLNDLKKWVMKSNDISEVSSIFSQKTETASLEEILKHVFSTGGDLSKEAEFNNYLGNVEGAKFKEDIFGFFREEIKKDVDILEKMATKKHTQKRIAADGKSIEEVKDKKVSDVEHMIREIVHALHHNKMSNEFFEHVKDGIKELIIDLDKKYAGGENDFEDVFLSFMGDLIKYVKSIK